MTAPSRPSASDDAPPIHWLPDRRWPAALALLALSQLLARLMFGAATGPLWLLAGGLATALVAAAVDLAWSRRAWRAAPIVLQRRVPKVLALGVAQEVQLLLSLDGTARRAWQGELIDGIDPGCDSRGLPLDFRLPPGHRLSLDYALLPRHRGAATLTPATLRLRSRFGLWTLQVLCGPTQALRVYPDFSALARFAWLASDQRLAEMGIRQAQRRGGGTDFRQLADYQPGDPVRQIDWKASQRRGRPVVRQYQDERDQRVVFLLDCGRRMRADDLSGPHQAQHFDHVLNALALTAHVALRAGDEVGLLTFGHDPGQGRQLAPRKGQAALDGLLAAVHDLVPGNAHPDYAQAAKQLMRAVPRRALVIVLTNFRDDDAGEMLPALQLLRQRHLALVASLREPAFDAFTAQAVDTPQAAAEVATAHLLAQARADAFARLPDPLGLMIDVAPKELAPALVTRYLAAKRRQLL